ncbi:MAG: RNA polymerase sigma factor [Eubacteriales bacterium]|nr:RNA polymerase sigma factor [Eubacteriales bacterium]
MNEKDMDFLVNEYGESVYRYCKSITYTLDDAEDLYQQTYLKAFELQKKIKKEENPKAYLMSIATNLWKNHKSQYARRQRIAPTISTEEEGVQVEDIKAEHDLLNQVVQNELNDQIRSCVAKLPDKQRQVIVLFYAAQLSIEEIAKILRIPKGTVKSRLNKARAMLKEEMEVQGYGE